jgi:hypothetical protein
MHQYIRLLGTKGIGRRRVFVEKATTVYHPPAGFWPTASARTVK